MPDAVALFDVNLQTCPDDWFIGNWQVRRRGFGPPSLFSQALSVRLYSQPNQLEVISTENTFHSGQWTIERDTRLQRPYLTLTTASEQTRALVTRLRRSTDSQAADLTLYLQNGTELELTRSSFL